MKPTHAPVLSAPAPEQVTAQHVDNVLCILAELHHYLFPRPPVGPFESSTPQETPRLDGEANIAATTTFIKACSRLDAILDDPDRWTLDPHKALYAAINANYAQQFEFLKAQTAASNSICRPMFLMKPDLARLEDGSFIAYVGDITTPGCGLIGQGKTPAEAFADFDEAFHREQQIQLEKTEQPKPPKIPKKKK